MKKFILFFAISLSINYGCIRVNKLTPSEYIKWINNPENGLNKSMTYNNLSIYILYKPVPYIIYGETDFENISSAYYNQRSNELNGLQYYTIRICENGQKKPSELLNYINQNLQNDLFLVEENDTFPCMLYHHEKNPDFAQYQIIHLAFKNNNSLNPVDKKIVINKSILMEGKIEIFFYKEDFKNEPEIINNEINNINQNKRKS